MHDLGTLGGTSSRATAVNDFDQLTGNAGIAVGSTAAHAFRYTGGLPGSGGVMQDLGTLGGPTSRGYGINASGKIVGDSQITGGAVTTFHAFHYTGTPGVDGVMTDLGTLGGTISAANAINNAGQIAGASQTSASSDYHAFLYTGTPGPTGTMRDLGTLGGAGSAAYAINNSGQLVGAANTSGGAAHAMIYTGTPLLDGVMTDLDLWLDLFHPAEGVNWTLSDANWLTDGGLVTGSGTFNDGAGGLTDGLRGFILDARTITKPIPGDANFDGKVDVADLGALATNWQKPGNRSQGDFDGTGFVNVNDLGILASNWQAGVGGGGSSASLADALQSFGLSASTVPEPGILVLVGQLAVLYRLRGRRRRR
jgi:probable HAF family extracellular repeat protein